MLTHTKGVEIRHQSNQTKRDERGDPKELTMQMERVKQRRERKQKQIVYMKWRKSCSQQKILKNWYKRAKSSWHSAQLFRRWEAHKPAASPCTSLLNPPRGPETFGRLALYKQTRSVLQCVGPLECERHKVPLLQTRKGSANPTVMPTIRFNCRPCLSESIIARIGTDLYFFARGCRHQLNTTQNDFNCTYFRGPIN